MSRKPKFKDSDDAKLREDTAETAYRVLQEAIGDKPKTKPPEERSEDEKDPEAVKRGKQGGSKGGKARAESLSERKLRQIAKKAARARWREQGE